MSTEKLRELVESGPEGKSIGMIYALYRLGGWVVLATAGVVGIYFIYNAQARMTEAYIDDLRGSRDLLAKIVAQNSVALDRSSQSNESVASALRDWRDRGGQN